MKFDLSSYLQDLEYLVNTDSGSTYREGIARVAKFFNQKFSELGWKVTVHDFNSAAGPCLEIVNNESDHYDTLLMGHMDTVFKQGTAAERPFTIKGDKAFGPGIADMKAGLLYIYYVMESLHSEGRLNNMSVCIALNSDEEISSRYSRPWLERLSRKSSNALVLEPARANGNFVNKRKGVARYSIEFSGKAAHAGVDPQNGSSAIQELGHWILALHSRTNFETGTTVNVGIVTGGSAANVVADQAKAEVDVRICDIAEAEALERMMRELVEQPKTPGVTVKVSGGVTRPPMNPSKQTLDLCHAVEQIAADLGINIGWSFTGGGSDGNFSAALGVPTIDALGPIGGSTHGIAEYLDIASIEPRFYLLRRIIEHLEPK